MCREAFLILSAIFHLTAVGPRYIVPFNCHRLSAYTALSRIRRSATAKRSISARGVVSVTQTSPCFVSSGNAVPSANGPAIFSLSNSPLIMRTDLGNSSVNSLKNGPSNARLTPGILSSSLNAKWALARFTSSSFFSPASLKRNYWSGASNGISSPPHTVARRRRCSDCLQLSVDS